MQVQNSFPFFLKDFRATVMDATGRLREISSAASRQKSAPDDWSRVEILGHLIDSAANNHQRFVRAQEADALTFPGYNQNHWVTSQAYQDADWQHLVALWSHLNLHLADVIARIPPSNYSVPCTIGGNPAVPLETIIVGYRDHLHHHIAQIRERLS